MKTIALLCLTSCLTLALAPRPADVAPQTSGQWTIPADDQATRAIAEAWKSGYNQGDSARVASLYAEDVYCLTQHFAIGVNLVVLRKIAGKWLIVAHESAVPDPATAIQTLDPAQ